MPRDHHEERVVTALRALFPGCEQRQEVSMPRKARRFDLLYVFCTSPPAFGPWAERLARRPLIIEHFARRVGFVQLCDVVTAHAWLCGQWYRDRRGARRRRRLPDALHELEHPPMSLVLACGGVRPGLSESGLGLPLERDRFEGAQTTPPDASGGVLILDLTTLPNKPGLSFLRWLPTPTTDEEATRRYDALLGDPGLPTIFKERIQEAVMSQSIVVTPAEELTAYERAKLEGRVEGRAEGRVEGREQGLQVGRRAALLRVARAVAGDAAERELEQIEDLDALEVRVLELVGR